MNLRLVREPSSLGATMGVLFVNGAYECFTLEDQLRPDGKIAGETAIPSGRYQIKLTFSNRFQRIMPELLNVPNFTGVRLHAGNTTADTQGCPLVGADRGVAMVLRSRFAFAHLMAQLEQATDDIWITVENPSNG